MYILGLCSSVLCCNNQLLCCACVDVVFAVCTLVTVKELLLVTNTGWADIKHPTLNKSHSSSAPLIELNVFGFNA